MVSNKGKRKLIFNGKTFYWLVRKSAEGKVRIHILSEDKKMHLECSPFDSEVPVTPKEIRSILKNHFDEKGMGII